MHHQATNPKYGATPRHQRTTDAQCLMPYCVHPPAGPDDGRLDAGLANFCCCHGRELLAAFPLPGDDAVDLALLGVCADA